MPKVLDYMHDFRMKSFLNSKIKSKTKYGLIDKKTLNDLSLICSDIKSYLQSKYETKEMKFSNKANFNYKGNLNQVYVLNFA